MDTLVTDAPDQSVPFEPTALASALDGALAPVHQFKILRAFLIDSLTKGRITELVTDGGAVITGRNGRGKTSMLQFLPLFYGVNPNKLVSPGKDSFIKYYLPNSTSYIVFEYQRDDGSLRLVVAYSNSTGDKVFYRFVRSGYEKRLFVLENNEFVKNKDFRARLSELRIECSLHQIENYADYKSVIQYGKVTSADRKQQEYLKRLSADYAFSRYGTQLNHVDKIVLGMFSRKTNFEDLQAMVVDCVSEDAGTESVHSIRSDRKKIEEWPRHFRAYSAVMLMQPVMVQAEAEADEHTQVRHTLSGLKTKLTLLADHLTSEEAKERQAALDARSARDAGVSEQAEKVNGLEKSRIQVEMKAAEVVKKVQALIAQFDEYKTNGMDDKVEKSKTINQVLQDIQGLESRLAALEGSFANIAAKYEQVKVNLANDLEGDRARYREELDEVSRQCEEFLAKAEQRFTEHEKEVAADAEAPLKTLNEAVQEAGINLGVAQQNAKSPQADRQIAERVSIKDEEVTRLRAKRDEADRASRTANQAVERCKKDEEAADASVLKHIKRIGEQEILIESIRRSHTPAEGSLLHVLRNEHPEWKHDIAKVIREDLLHRTDLSPQIIESSENLYGLCLDLEVLEALPQADESVVLAQIEAAQATLTALQTGRKTAEAERDTAAAALKAAQQVDKAAGKERLDAVSSVQVSETELAALKLELRKSFNDAQSLADAALQNAKDAFAARKVTLAEFETKQRESMALRRNAYAQKRSQAINERDNGLQRIKTSLKNREMLFDSAVRDCNAERDEVLRKEGADVEQINALKTQLATLAKERDLIRASWSEVQQYKLWLTNEYVHREGVEAQALELTRQEADLAGEIKALEQAWKAQAEALNATAAAADLRVDVLSKESAHVSLGIERLVNVTASEETVAFDPTWTTDGLIVVLNQQLDTEKVLIKKISGYVQQIKKSFTQQVNTPPFDYMQEAGKRLDNDTPLGWLKVFREWFETRHSDMRQILMTEVRTITAEIELFHRKLSTFTNRINSFNRELQKYLDSSTCFDSISGLTVSIISTVDELKYWPAIKRLVDARREWSDVSTTLPDMEFVQMLEGLLEHWELKNGINADFKHMVSIRGEVVENGNVRSFKNSADLDNVSSNGLSYLVLVIIFIAFLNRIRRNVPINLVWSLDELKAIDSGNIVGLCKLLSQNNITLVSAFPDPDAETLMLFKNAYTIEPDRCLTTAVVTGKELNLHEVAANV
ncbi:ATP-binding protein [Pseudomonas serbica]|uniref:ATP-binding protein n=1 Tax=Pseudomonas serbica TaxID=2965074 RepID=UPI00237AAF4F|nr:ATP-binding protein [Pseudomonas serbica]